MCCNFGLQLKIGIEKWEPSIELDVNGTAY